MELVRCLEKWVDNFEEFFSHVCVDIFVIWGVIPDDLSFSSPFAGCELWSCIVQSVVYV